MASEADLPLPGHSASVETWLDRLQSGGVGVSPDADAACRRLAHLGARGLELLESLLENGWIWLEQGVLRVVEFTPAQPASGDGLEIPPEWPPQDFMPLMFLSGFDSDPELWLSLDIGYDIGWEAADTFRFFRDRGIATLEGSRWNLDTTRLPEASAEVSRIIAQRLGSTSARAVSTDEIELEFPSVVASNPILFGVISEIESDGARFELAEARGVIRLPLNARLSLTVVGFREGIDPFHGVPSALFEEVIVPRFSESDHMVWALRHLGDLMALHIHGRGTERVSNTATETIADFTNLRSLTLLSSAVTDRGLIRLAGLPRLTSLKLGWGDITHRGLDVLPLEQLTELSIEHPIRPLAAHVGLMRRLERVEKLSLWGRAFDRRALGGLSRLVHLNTLTLTPALAGPSTERIGDAIVEHLSQLDLLEELQLPYTGVTDWGAERLSANHRLTRLNLDTSAITDTGVCHLSRLRYLRELSLGKAAISEASIDYLLRMEHLETLNLNETEIPIRDLARLRGHPSLRQLVVPHLKDRPEEARWLAEQLPGLDIEWTYETFP